jgi:PST family polysaccharide transporter
MLKFIKQNVPVVPLNPIYGEVLFWELFLQRLYPFHLGTSGMASLGSFRNFAGMIKSVATLGINNSFIVTLRIKRIRMN